MLEATNPVIICYSAVKKLMAVIKDEEEFSRGKKWESKTYIFLFEENYRGRDRRGEQSRLGTQ